MSLVDLHIHTTASDGTLSPSDIVSLAISKNLEAIAITDHDTVSGIQEAFDASAGKEIEIIPGIELSCMYGSTEIHILGLFVDVSSEVFLSSLNRQKASRNARNEEIIIRLNNDGILISREELLSKAADTSITRAHFARLLFEKGYASSMDQAFKKYLTYGGKYCVRYDSILPEEAMELLTCNGAFPVLAHPMQYHMGYREIEKLIVFLKKLGLAGLEVYHPSQHSGQSTKLKELALKHNLLPTGGSDFHGDNKPDINIGTGRGSLRVSSLLLDDIKNRRKQNG